MAIYFVLHDATQQVCSVEASNKDKAKEKIAELLGQNIDDEPIYCADNEDDLKILITTVANADAKEQNH